jgi:hypothetical protein
VTRSLQSFGEREVVPTTLLLTPAPPLVKISCFFMKTGRKSDVNDHADCSALSITPLDDDREFEERKNFILKSNTSRL